MPKYTHLTHFISLCVQIWLCQNLVKFNNQFVKLLIGPQKQTCLFQIKRILGFCCRYGTKILIWVTQRKGIDAFRLTFSFCLQRLLQCCRDDSLNVTVPMRMLEIFFSEKTYHPVIEDASLVTSLLEQILHYMVPKGNASVICPVFVSFFYKVLGTVSTCQHSMTHSQRTMGIVLLLLHYLYRNTLE